MSSQMGERWQDAYQIERKHLPYQTSIMQLLKGANASKIARVFREMQPRHKTYAYHRSRGDPQLPIVARAVRMGRALFSLFLQIAKKGLLLRLVGVLTLLFTNSPFLIPSEWWHKKILSFKFPCFIELNHLLFHSAAKNITNTCLKLVVVFCIRNFVSSQSRVTWHLIWDRLLTPLFADHTIITYLRS